MNGFRALFRDGRGGHTAMLQLGIALHAMDAFLIAAVMPTVVADIGGVRFYAWVSMLYMVGSIMGSASAGALHALLGARRAVLAGGGVFLAGSLACAMAPSMPVLIGTRFVQGTGGGLLVALAMTLISALYPPELRKRMLAATSLMWALAALAGPALGGLAAEFGHWRAAFGVNVPALLAFLVLAVLHLPAGLGGRTRPVFPAGRVALLGGAVLAVAAAGQAHGALQAGALLGLGLALIGAALWRDARAAHVILPAAGRTLRSGVGVSYLMLALISVTHVMVGVFIPLLMQQVYGLRPLVAGYFGSVLALGWTGASLLTSGWHGARERRALRGGPVLMTLAVLGLWAGQGHLPPLAVAGCVAVLGVGIGSLSLHLIARAMALAPPGEETATSAAIPVVRGLGMAFGAAVAGAVATTAGLRVGLDAQQVARALAAVYAAALLAPLGLLVLSHRLLRIGAPVRTATPGTAAPAPDS
jgi:MFS family permease